MTGGPTTRDGRTDPAPSDWPIVPGYELLAELGRGGMGVVYKARQAGSQRLVALKLIRDGALAGPVERARFRIEAEAAARVRHPNVVAVLETGEHQGRPWFTMELVEGGSLDEWIANGPPPTRAAAELVRTLAHAVHHAHEQKVIHRDLKPANVLLQSGEGTDRSVRATVVIPKISDFGLAKRLDSESTAWTRDGAVLGTAAYMAPEQAAGRVRELGPAGDIYALGAILYELLTGRPPFDAGSWHEMLQQVLHDDPAPPTRLRAEVPRDLETICLKCLEKEPGRRYASAEELADDLARFLDGARVIAQPPGEREHLIRLAARDGFTLGEESGRGPRSTVYRALSGPLQQPLAVKVFTIGICTREDWEARVRRSAEFWPTLSHPQIVPVLHAGWWDGAPFVATEYVSQGSLADRLSGRPYPLPEALRLVEHLSEIVTYLHRQGVVHANLKPANVLLAADGIPRIVDFRLTSGLHVGLPPTGTEELSLAGVPDTALSGGIACLPAELVREPSAEPGPHTDIYGLGLILYELLTGRPAFGAATVQETLEQVCTQDPLPPSTLNSRVAPALEAVCLRCLRKDPLRRYHRAFDLTKRLRAFL